MIEGQEIETNSDANIESSSETPSTEGSEGSANVAASNQEATNVPFHEHPRFKELVEQKNQALAAQKAQEERYAQLEARLNSYQAPQAQAKASDELIEDLRKIDPRLAQRLEQFTQAMPTVESMQKRLEAFEQQNARQSAVTQVNALHEQNKVSPEHQQMINDQLDLMYMRGELKDLSAISGAYKQVHSSFTKLLDSVKRSERESYVQGKKVDSKVPTSQPKGKPAAQTQGKDKFSADPEIAKQQIVSRYLKTARAESDI